MNIIEYYKDGVLDYSSRLMQGWLFYHDSVFWTEPRTRTFLTSIPLVLIVQLNLKIPLKLILIFKIFRINRIFIFLYLGKNDSTGSSIRTISTIQEIKLLLWSAIHLVHVAQLWWHPWNVWFCWNYQSCELFISKQYSFFSSDVNHPINFDLRKNLLFLDIRSSIISKISIWMKYILKEISWNWNRSDTVWKSKLTNFHFPASFRS